MFARFHCSFFLVVDFFLTKSYPTLFQESGLCTKHGVSGYPTIKYFLSGDKTPKDFSGGRQLDALRKFTAVRSLLELDMDNFCVIIWRTTGHPGSEMRCDRSEGMFREGGQVY